MAKRGKVLLMDDEEGIRDIAKQILTHLGCEVVVAARGEDTITIFCSAMEGNSPFDLVILDLNVTGGMGGIEAFQELKAADPGVRAIISSGFTDDPAVSDSCTIGFAGVMPKPYRIKDVREILDKYLPEKGI